MEKSFIELSQQEKVDYFIDMIKRDKCSLGDHKYEFEYFEHIVQMELSDEELQEYVSLTLQLVDIISRKERDGSLTKQKVSELREKARNNSGEKSDFICVITAFSTGGIYSEDEILNIIDKLGELEGCYLKSAYWIIVKKPHLCSAVIRMVEATIGHLQEEDAVLLSAWYFFRSCMFIRTQEGS